MTQRQEGKIPLKAYRGCSCRDPLTGRPYGRGKCPRLAQRGHGGWYGRFEAPPDPDGKRRQPRIGPFSTQKEAKDALTVALGQVRDRKFAADRRTTVGEYLRAWLEDQRPSLKPRTWDSYEEAIRLYFAPGIGHIRLADLHDQPIRDVYNAMRKINRPTAEDGGEMLRRLLAARAVVPHLRHLWGTKPIGEGGIKRRHAGRAHAQRPDRNNPASTVVRGAGAAHGPTQDRWQTGRRPAAGMVWTRYWSARFLD